MLLCYDQFTDNYFKYIVWLTNRYIVNDGDAQSIDSFVYFVLPFVRTYNLKSKIIFSSN